MNIYRSEAWLALDYVTRRPARVESVVLLCPAGVGRQKKSFLFKAIPLLLLGRWGRRRAMSMLGGSATADARAPSADVADFANFVSLIFKHFRPRRERVPVFSDEALKRVTMPVMLIVGGRDALLDSQETKRRLERLAPRLTVRFLPEAGHLLRNQATPIREFLRASTIA